MAGIKNLDKNKATEQNELKQKLQMQLSLVILKDLQML